MSEAAHAPRPVLVFVTGDDAASRDFHEAGIGHAEVRARLGSVYPVALPLAAAAPYEVSAAPRVLLLDSVGHRLVDDVLADATPRTLAGAIERARLRFGIGALGSDVPPGPPPTESLEPDLRGQLPGDVRAAVIQAAQLQGASPELIQELVERVGAAEAGESAVSSSSASSSSEVSSSEVSSSGASSSSESAIRSGPPGRGETTR